MNAVDFHFGGTHPAVVKNAIRLLYDNSIDVQEKHFQRFGAFLKILEIEFDIKRNSESQLNVQTGNKGDERVSIIKEKDYLGVLGSQGSQSFPLSPTLLPPSVEGHITPTWGCSRSEEHAIQTPNDAPEVASSSEGYPSMDVNIDPLPESVFYDK